eukprot:765392-Hanusia_phi.AAC.3
MTIMLELVHTGSSLKRIVPVILDQQVEGSLKTLPQVVSKELVRAVKRAFNQMNKSVITELETRTARDVVKEILEYTKVTVDISCHGQRRKAMA